MILFDFWSIINFFSMTEFRGGIIRLFEQGKSGYQIAKDMKLPYTTVRDTIRRYRETENYNDRPRSGRPRTARTPAKIRKIKGWTQRNPNSRMNSTRKMAKGTPSRRNSRFGQRHLPWMHRSRHQPEAKQWRMATEFARFMCGGLLIMEHFGKRSMFKAPSVDRSAEEKFG